MQDRPLPPFAIFDDYRPTVAIAVVIRWLLLGAWFVLNNYRGEEGFVNLALNLMGVALAGVNAYMTWRVVKHRPITWRHAFVLSAGDLTMITAGLFLSGGWKNEFYVFYYPALLGFSLMFPKRASFAVAGLVMGLYTLMAFTISPTLDLVEEDEKKLVVRLINMLGLVAAGGLITRWERARRREAVAAERKRAQENLELARKAQEAEVAAVEERSRIAREIHDGIAQSIYMLSISLEACTELASRGQNGLQERLKSLVNLSRQALLDTRYYIFDLKPMLDGNRSVVEMLEHQVQEFSTVTSVPATFSVEGAERPLAVAVNAGLFRIAQEGLANVYKHAQASRVDLRLEFADGQVRLQIEDNGQGFVLDGGKPGGYGLGNMEERARELRGHLDIESVPGQGTRLTLTLPAPAPSGITT